MRSKVQFLFSWIAVTALLLSHLAMPLHALAASSPTSPDTLVEAAPSVTTEIEGVAMETPVNSVDNVEEMAANRQVSALQTITPSASIALSPISTYDTNIEDESAVEIVTFDPTSDRLFVTNAFSNSVTILGISAQGELSEAGSIDLSPYGAGVNSVDFANGRLAVAVEADPKQDPGKVVVFDSNGTEQFQVEVGPLPDMVTFTPDGTKILVANEGEPSDDYLNDPEGSISIIDVPSTLINPAQTATTVDFKAFNDATDLDPSIRIFGGVAGFKIYLPLVFKSGTSSSIEADEVEAPEPLQLQTLTVLTPSTVAQDLEPEYIAVSPDSSTAYVTLQENNAVAIVDIANAQVTSLVGLGFKDHSVAGNELDASDKDDTNDRDDQEASGATDVDGEINIKTWPVKGMYQPDAIAAYDVGGTTYLVTANEGDARDYDGFSEEARIKDLKFDSSLDSSLQDDDKLGRLNTTLVNGDTDGDGDFDEIYAFGARSFSIWNGTNGSQVYDSGSDFEYITAAFDPTIFNSQDGDSFDGRSDNKGSEPEGVTLGVLDGRTYAFILLERIGGIMVYDVTTPSSPTFVQYVNTRYAPYEDQAPEGAKFISAADSPTGTPLLAVSFEFSGSVTLFEISSDPDGAGRLTLMHNNDGESALLPIEVAVPAGQYGNATTETIKIGGVATFKSETDEQINNARGLGHAVVDVYAGDAFLASSTLNCTLDDADGPVYDALAQRQIAYDAHIFGNHEFDFGPDFTARFVKAFQTNGVLVQPFLSSNLDFDSTPSFDGLINGNEVIEGYSTNGEVVAHSAIVIDEVTGQRFGIVGATTPSLNSISSPGSVMVTTTNITDTATLVQTEVDRLTGKGVQKIIFVSHLQSLTNDEDLISRLSDVDLAVGGGGDELLTNPNAPGTVNQVIPGEVESVNGDYPKEITDADGQTVYLVTGVGQYKYVGRLDVEFGADGEVTQVINETTYPRMVIPSDDAANANLSTRLPDLNADDVVEQNKNVVDSVITPVESCLAALGEPLIGLEVVLDMRRSEVRTKETNGGNSIADSYLWVYDEYATTNNLPARDATVIGMANGGGIRIDNFLPTDQNVPGTMSRKDTRDNLPFGNLVAVVSDVTPQEVKQTFERAASSLPGQGGQFLQIAAGLKVTYNISNTAQAVDGDAEQITQAGSRVVSIELSDGTKIVDGGAVQGGAPNLTIVTAKFTADGGDDYFWLKDNAQVTLTDNDGVIFDYEQAWTRYLLNDPAFTVETIGSFTGPTIQSDDTRYQPGGEGRITITTN